MLKIVAYWTNDYYYGKSIDLSHSLNRFGVTYEIKRVTGPEPGRKRSATSRDSSSIVYFLVPVSTSDTLTLTLGSCGPFPEGQSPGTWRTRLLSAPRTTKKKR